MPELPDLEALKEFLNQRIVGLGVTKVQTFHPIVLRRPAAEFSAILEGNHFQEVGRRGKFILFPLASGHILAINCMLAGRLQYCPPRERRRAKTAFTLDLSNGFQLRYFDAKQMGKVYLVEEDRLEDIPRFNEMGPEANDAAVTLDAFRQRLRRHPGQVKNILTNDAFLAGIGNAYADEILFAAGIHPYRRRTQLSSEEVAALHRAMGKVLAQAIATVKERLGEKIEVEVRDFLQVHGKGGQPCPRCAGTIAEITANQRLTNFCWNCQKP